MTRDIYRTWDGAKRLCDFYGTSLAYFEDSSTAAEFSRIAGEKVWVGIYDAGERDWRYITKDKAYFYWGRNEPYGGSKCVETWGDGDYGNKGCDYERRVGCVLNITPF